MKGSSALLHLLRASLEHSLHDKFSSQFMFDPENGGLEEPSRRFRSESALEVLLNTRNRKLRLYPLEEKSRDETVVQPDGRRETLTKTVTTYTTVEDRVVEIYESLEKIIDHEAQAEASAEGANMKPRLHDRIQGWDFQDVAIGCDPLYLRVAKLTSIARSWVDLCKTIRAVTLFGLGYGDILKPAQNLTPDGDKCPALWQSLPSGRNLLAACVSDLKDIIDSHGDKTDTPLKHCTILDRTAGSEKNPIRDWLPTHSTLRRLLPEKTKPQVAIDNSDERCQHGAVIFGPSHDSTCADKKLPDKELSILSAGTRSAAAIHAAASNPTDSPGSGPELSDNQPNSASSASTKDNSTLTERNMQSPDTGQTSSVESRSRDQAHDDQSCAGGLRQPASSPSLPASGVDDRVQKVQGSGLSKRRRLLELATRVLQPNRRASHRLGDGLGEGGVDNRPEVLESSTAPK